MYTCVYVYIYIYMRMYVCSSLAAREAISIEGPHMEPEPSHAYHPSAPGPQ